jgi:enamine deaminase RidA (YjgF/YER057c/UK114 family)
MPHQRPTTTELDMAITHLNPASMHRSPAFSQGTVIPAGSSLVIVGGQNGVGPDGKIVGDSIEAQTEQAMRNLLAVLAEAGAGPADVAKLTIYLVEGVDLNAAFGASRAVWGDQPTAVSGLFVRGLGVPGALVEVEAIAAVPA